MEHGVVSVGRIVETIEAAYPPALAESWDSVGLVCGDPDEPVTRVHVCVDVTEAVVDEALAAGAGMILAHHPLLLRGVDTVGAHTPKGRLIHRMIRGGCALLTAHTNADSADPGVSDALAGALGLTGLRPIAPKTETPQDKWIVLVPETHAAQVRTALFAAGAGALGDYDSCAWTVAGTGQFRPLDGADPTLGRIGAVHTEPETRVEVLAPRAARETVRAALRAAHPYEEPAYDVFEPAPGQTSRGLGRIGELARPETLADFADRVARALPATVWGVRAAGDPQRTVRTVAVCGGAGDSLLGAVTAAGVDAYVTADLRHHPADEHLRRGGPALIDVAHWASEQPWCGQAAEVLRAAFGERLDVHVTALRTDPWTVGGAN